MNDTASSSTLSVVFNNDEVNVESKIFSTSKHSTRGRCVKPTAKMSDLIAENDEVASSSQSSFDSSKKEGPGSKSFMEQFSMEDRKIIEIVEKESEKEEKEYNEKEKKQAQKRPKLGEPIENKNTKKPSTVKGRLAKKLKLKF